MHSRKWINSDTVINDVIYGYISYILVFALNIFVNCVNIRL